jgi:galactarate dehydratase|tara:strand:- start:224 stop:388 length:165 start_codon:yes stop_codon:yes gene_type:complete
MTVTNPIIVKIDPADNVAIVANDGGLQAGTEVPGGIVLKDLLIGNSIVPIRFGE